MSDIILRNFSQVFLVPSNLVPLSYEVKHHVDTVQSNAEDSGRKERRGVFGLWKCDLNRRQDNHDTDLNDVDEAPN